MDEKVMTLTDWKMYIGIWEEIEEIVPENDVEDNM